jgi:hypothetical protein
MRSGPTYPERRTLSSSIIRFEFRLIVFVVPIVRPVIVERREMTKPFAFTLVES